jgi:hypothetical protein
VPSVKCTATGPQSTGTQTITKFFLGSSHLHTPHLCAPVTFLSVVLLLSYPRNFEWRKLLTLITVYVKGGSFKKHKDILIDFKVTGISLKNHLSQFASLSSNINNF